MSGRTQSFADRLVCGLDNGLRTLAGVHAAHERSNPADSVEDNALSDAERRRSAALLRVDHAGEVAAQALYQGQALIARTTALREKFYQASAEENAHLSWCAERLQQLGHRRSAFTPVWYAGSFAIGAFAGLLGDRLSLGFLAETERQVVEHLDRHLADLPADDRRSRAILQQMQVDESQHATAALEAGGAELPGPVKSLMRSLSRVMTGTAYYI